MEHTGRYGVSRVLPRFETQSLEEARVHMSTVFRSHRLRLAGRAPLSVRHESRRTGRMSLHWLRYGTSVDMSAPEMDDFYLFQFTLQGHCDVTHGQQSASTSGGEAYVVDPARPLTKAWAADCEQLIIKIDREEFESFMQQEAGIDAMGRLAFHFRPIRVGSDQPGLLPLLQSLGREIPAGGGFYHQRVMPHLEPTLMALLLSTFPHSLQGEFDRATQPCAPFYVRRAEQYIRTHARSPIKMDDVVAAAGVSSRSLFNGFRRFRDTTPMAYIKAVRLDLAKDELTRAEPTHATVTDIAIGCGFTHLSKFARDFKLRFGISPLTLLKQDSK
jgi:AraC-like DNA-binding protein